MTSSNDIRYTIRIKQEKESAIKNWIIGLECWW